MTSRWLRRLVVLVALLALYSAVGFMGVPRLVRWQLPRIAADQLERHAAVGPVRFNPFTLALQLRGLRLDDTDGSLLLAIDTIDTQLRWRSLVDRAWTLQRLHVVAAQARLAVAPDGRFNLAALLDSLRRHRQPGDPHDGTLPRVVIQDFALTQGRLEWDDRQAGCQAVLTPLELRFARLSTLPDERNGHTLAAAVAGGGQLRWRGQASLNPISASGEFVLDDIPLATLGAYLKPWARAVVSGRASAALPYSVAYDGGRMQAKLHGARVAIADLAARPVGQPQPFLTLREAAAHGVDGDLQRRELGVGTLRLAGGALAVARDERGAWDVAQMLGAPPAPAAAPEPATPWKAAVRQVELEALAIRLADATWRPGVTAVVDGFAGRLRLEAEQGASAMAATVTGDTLRAARIVLSPGGAPPLTLEHVGVQQAQVDLAAHRIAVGRIEVGGGRLHLARDAQGRFALPAARAGPAPAANGEASPWTARIEQVALARIGVELEDAQSGIRTELQDVALRLDNVGTDLAQPVRFEAGLRLREGGELATRGRVVPASGSVQAEVQARHVALALGQPLLARHLRLKLASGTFSTQGRLEGMLAPQRPPALRYEGSFEVANLRLNETNGDLFARWTQVSAPRFTADLRGLDIPDLRVVAPEASLIIEDDRSFNAARLLVAQPARAQPARAAAAAPAAPAFAVRVQRLRLQDARLQFVDLSLRPQFGARIYALNGVVTGLSSRRDARSQVELDGRVDQYGLARIRGSLNPFAPRDNTDLAVVFRNVDMVPASPYSMKFAGYRIAEGRISSDLRYRVRNGRLEGDNRIVIDRLTLGERVDSPDALKLPLELAIAVLKDGDGRIELGLPVSGDLNDPQFSYGALIWKAVVNVITKVVSAPFRALGNLLGGGEKLEAIEFDPGSAVLLPPEREKLRQVADLLARRAQLRVAVPGQFDETLDGAALKAARVRTEVLRRAGRPVDPDESGGPLDFGDRSIRAAVRELYVQRFGAAAWDAAKAAAERETPAAAAAAPSAGELSVLRRVRNFVQGEPQVGDPSGFYQGLLGKLQDGEAIAPDALAQLGARRAQAVVAALGEAGVDGSRAAAGAPGATQAGGGKLVPVRLELATLR